MPPQLRWLLFSILLISSASAAKAADATFTVLTFNIHHGRGTDGVIDEARIASVIRDSRADLVLLNEVDQGARRSGYRDQVALLAELSGLDHVHFEPALVRWSWPGRQHRYGNVFLSRYPFAEAGSLSLPKLDGDEPRNVLYVTVNLPAGLQMTAFGTHLSTRRASRILQTEALAGLEAEPGLRILLGDFNARPGSPEWLRVTAGGSGPWHDAFLLAGGGEGNTFPAADPEARIDYIFINDELRERLQAVEIVETLASDHLPVAARFHLEPAAQPQEPAQPLP